MSAHSTVPTKHLFDKEPLLTPPRTVPDLLRFGAQRFSDRPAIVDGDVRLTYHDLVGAVEEVSAAYLAAGVCARDRVAIWVPNRHEFILALLGAQNVGAAVVPLNTRYRGHEARLILDRSRASVLITADGFLGTDYLDMLDRAGDGSTAGAISGLAHLHTVVDVAGGGHPAAMTWKQFLANGAQTRPDTVRAAAAEVTTETVCDILFTSGTTGVPKGVMSAHRQTIGVADVWARGAELGDQDRYAIVNPFFHGFGYKAGIMSALTAGSAIYPVPTFDPVGLMELVQRERITVLPGAPTIFTTLINHPRLSEFDLSSLRFAIAGAASVPESLFEQMLDILGFEKVAQAYGLTECIVATQSRPGEDPRHVAETTGPAVPGIEIQVVASDGEPVPVGTDGEIWLRGDNVMLGYFEDEQSTAEAIDAAGWFHTGDVGRLDEHGCLKITDRIKDMFIVGGFNVYPAEIENVLSRHPDVMESAIIGVPDDRLGSVGCAYIVPRPGARPTVEELSAYCKERLANFKVPRTFVIAETLPRNASGKVLKKELRDA